MEYLINRKTKEHKVTTLTPPEGATFIRFATEVWDIVEADDEGWIKHEGNECPLPDDCMVDTMWDDGQGGPRMAAGHWRWRDPSITHYKPILAEKVQEPEPTLPADCIETPDLFNRLDAAHQAAAQIPDIIAQIKAKLEQYGHTVVPLSPFVPAEFVEADPVAEPDMSDWRNWKYGDKLKCVNAAAGERLSVGMVVTLAQENSSVPYFYFPDGVKGCDYVTRFRFHSRPAKVEK